MRFHRKGHTLTEPVFIPGPCHGIEPQPRPDDIHVVVRLRSGYRLVIVIAPRPTAFCGQWFDADETVRIMLLQRAQLVGKNGLGETIIVPAASIDFVNVRTA